MGIFDMADHSMDGLDVVKLTTQFDGATIGIIESLLKNNDIPYMLRDVTNTGGFLRAAYVPAHRATGMHIFVKRDDHERAKGLLDAFVLGGGEPVEPDQE